MISRATRARRKELAALRKLRCVKHHLSGCDSAPCRYEIKLRFYNRQKKRPQRIALPGDVDSLFRLLRQPTKQFQGEF